MRTGKHRNVINWTYLIVGGTVGIIGTIAGILAGFHLARDRAEDPIVDVARNLKLALDEAGESSRNTVSGRTVDVEATRQKPAAARPIVSPEKAERQRKETEETQRNAIPADGDIDGIKQKANDAKKRTERGISQEWYDQIDEKIKDSVDNDPKDEIPDVYAWAVTELKKIYDKKGKDSSLRYPKDSSGTFEGFIDHFYPLTKATGRDGQAPNGWRNEKVGKLIKNIESRQNTSKYF